MKPTPELMASVLAALMQNPDIRAWVEDRARAPGSGGQMALWTALAYEYAESFLQATKP